MLNASQKSRFIMETPIIQRFW